MQYEVRQGVVLLFKCKLLCLNTFRDIHYHRHHQETEDVKGVDGLNEAKGVDGQTN